MKYEKGPCLFDTCLRESVCVCVRVLYALLQSTQNCSLILLAVKLPRGILETFCTFHAGYFQFVIRFC